MQKLIEEARHAPILSAVEEVELGTRWRQEGDVEAMRCLVQSHLRLLYAITRRYAAFGAPVADLLQEGSIGLLNAAHRFDPDKGVRFSTYATLWIKSTLRDYIRKNASVVRGSLATRALAAQALYEASEEAEARRACAAANTPPQMSQDKEKEIVAKRKSLPWLTPRTGDLSLNAAAHADQSAEWQDLLVGEEPSPEEALVETDEKTRRLGALHLALEKLNDRDRTIVRRRYLQERPITLKELGLELGVSKERVRQLEKRTLIRLQALMR